MSTSEFSYSTSEIKISCLFHKYERIIQLYLNHNVLASFIQVPTEINRSFN